jgi:hypothetical protein
MSSCDVAFITVMELSGLQHSLGSFNMNDKVEQVFSCTSDSMCVPVEVLQLVLDGKSVTLENDESQICNLGFTANTQLLALMRIPADLTTDLASTEYQQRIHAYTKLAELGCTFHGQGHTSATVNLLKQLIRLVIDGLATNTYPLVREAVVEALAKLSRHSLTLCDHDADVLRMMPDIAEAFGRLLQSSSWMERQLACAELGVLNGAGASEIPSLCDCCLDAANISVQVEAYKSLAQLLENGVLLPPHHLEHVAHVLSVGLETPYPIGEWACRGLACVGMAATPRMIDTLCELVVQEVDRHMRVAAAYALERLSQAGVDIAEP